MINPKMPDYDLAEWAESPFPNRVRMVCQSWALDGYGTPPIVFIAYLLKIAAYIYGWTLVMGVHGYPLGAIDQWWLSAEAFQTAVIWTVLFEILGWGCGSGPLTGRYMPPFGGFLYFLRPGTLKMPLLPGRVIVGRDTRSWLDAVVYLAVLVSLGGALFQVWSVLFVVLSLLALGILDKTAFLASRPDHYLIVLSAFLFSDWLPASKLIWVAIWWWAATSKLNRHFPSVVTVMLSNSPLAPRSFRKRMYRAFPDDLRPSRLAKLMAHGGTVYEYLFPLMLLSSSGGLATTAALTAMLVFHLFITSSIPMGVPLEWNVMMVYGGFFLFSGDHAAVRGFAVSSPPLISLLALALVVLPLVGNLMPSKVSFLMSMRYYAGNWAYSVWLFRGNAAAKLDAHLVKPSKTLQSQLGFMYDDLTIRGLLSKVVGFRVMHLHGRALQQLVPKAVESIDEYEWIDGELVAGQVVGWNFGEGHLHNLALLNAIQSRVGFAEGELRCIFVESQKLGDARLPWMIADANTGVLSEGLISVDDLVGLQPWPPLE